MSALVPGRAAGRVVVPVVVVLALLGLGGCRDGERAASPAPSTATYTDLLAGIESELDAVERDLDADAGRVPSR